MKKTIYYWSPCLNKVGTVISTKNSAISIAKYKKNEFNAKLINACGEWDEYKTDLIKHGVDVIDLNIKYFRYLPKTGYIPSRLSYLIIFAFNFLNIGFDVYGSYLIWFIALISFWAMLPEQTGEIFFNF